MTPLLLQSLHMTPLLQQSLCMTPLLQQSLCLTTSLLAPARHCQRPHSSATCPSPAALVAQPPQKGPSASSSRSPRPHTYTGPVGRRAHRPSYGGVHISAHSYPRLSTRGPHPSTQLPIPVHTGACTKGHRCPGLCTGMATQIAGLDLCARPKTKGVPFNYKSSHSRATWHCGRGCLDAYPSKLLL